MTILKKASGVSGFLAGAVTVAVGALAIGLSTSNTEARPATGEHDNKAIVKKAFDAWSAGTGSPYDLLREDARWTIVGHSAASRTYPDRESFLREVIRPFNTRMQAPLKPVVRGLFADGDTVIILFDASGIARDGVTYSNTYSWYLNMEDGRIASATAFYDSIAFNELWTRVEPAQATAN